MQMYKYFPKQPNLFLKKIWGTGNPCTPKENHRPTLLRSFRRSISLSFFSRLDGFSPFAFFFIRSNPANSSLKLFILLKNFWLKKIENFFCDVVNIGSMNDEQCIAVAINVLPHSNNAPRPAEIRKFRKVNPFFFQLFFGDVFCFLSHVLFFLMHKCTDNN